MDKRLQQDVRYSLTLLTLLVSSFYCAAVMFTTLAPISIVRLTGNSALLGLPPAIFLIAGMCAAYPAGRAMDAFGRVRVLSVGFLLGTVGTLLAAGGLKIGSAALFIGGIVIVGLSSGVIVLARVAASDLFPPEKQGKGVGIILVGAVFGGVLGPFIFSLSLHRIASSSSSLFMAWFTGACIMAVGLCLSLLFRRDTRELAREIRQQSALPSSGAATPRPGASGSIPLVLTTGAMGHALMVALMSLCGYIMKDHGHAMHHLFYTVGLHFVGMFGMALLVGKLVDRVGYTRTLVLGYALTAAAIAGMAAADRLPAFLASMFVLGVGWNCIFVSTTVKLTSLVPVAQRARYLGMHDLLASFIGAAMSLGAGYAVSQGYFQHVAAGALLLVGSVLFLIFSLKPGGRPIAA